MNKTSSFRCICKVYVLVAAALIIPALVYAKDIQFEKWDKDATWDKGDKWHKDDKGEKCGRGEKRGKGDPLVSAVPEANTVWVLVPFMGAVLLYSGRHLIRRKATE